MDDAIAPRAEGTAPETNPCVEPEDINAIFNLLLRREPEGPQIAESQRGRPLAAYFYAVLECPEFHSSILPAVVGRTPWPRYRGKLTFDRLRAWVARRPFLPPEVGERLVASASWPDFHRTLLSEQAVLQRTPKLRAYGVDKMIAELNSPSEQEGAEIEGDCDFINLWEIKGWCIDLLSADQKPTVEVLVGSQVVGSVVCQEFRRDLLGRMGGDGVCGFTYAVPPAVREALREEQWVSVRERSTGTPIGQPVAVRNHGPARAVQFDALKEEVARARRSLERLEAEMARATGSIGYHLAAYDEFVRAQAEPDDAALAGRLTASFGSSQAPLVSILLALDGEATAAGATLASLLAQAYPNWELVVAGEPGADLEPSLTALADAGREVRRHAGNLQRDAGALNEACLETASGQHLIILSPGDRLSREALLEMAIAASGEGVAAVYADEDRREISAAGEIVATEPKLKPGFDPDYLLSADFIGRAVMLRTAAVRALGGFCHGLAAAGLLDVLLRVHETLGGEAIAHCPRVLFHAPAAMSVGDGEAARSVVNAHLARVSPGAIASPHDDPEGGARVGARRVTWPLPPAPPPVSIIIPTKDHPELLGPCLASLRAHLSDYAGEVEIFVVDNGTSEPIASALLASLAEAQAIRLARYPGPFNWSALNNRAVAEARGGVLVFLNNDIVMLRPGWLSELVSQALRPEVGAVGARLLYADRSIQHAGMVVGVAGASCHESIGQPVGDGGYLGRTQVQHRVSAVTGACLATRREVFERLAGFDEAAFKVSFNDTDYCMKARAAGLAVVYTPVATMLHFESVSRGWDAAPPEAGEVGDEIALFREKWRDALRQDPFYNPHFDRAARPFTYLAARRP